MEMIESLRCVDAVALNDGPGRELVYEFEPEVLVVGSDWLRKDYLGQIDMDEYGVWRLGLHIIFVSRTPGVSSSERRGL